MKRIFFSQQRPFFYIPLRWGLGQYSDEQITKFSEMFKPDAPDHPNKYCKKVFTTRTHPMQGEYYVVEGSRFKAKPVVPEIRFKVTKVAELNLHGVLTVLPGNEFDFSWKTFPEMDLGVKGATFADLSGELLRLNKKATMETPFYVNLLEP